jgi:23S rRNA (guanosine2251-2'-O)-methyltransferase
LLDNFRSLYNVGSLFRTADGAAVEQLLLCGFTGTPPQNGIAKTALGAEKTVPWAHYESALEAALTYRERGYEVAAVETSIRSVDLFDWVPRFPVCLVFGNELHGIGAELLETADTHVRIPMLGAKHSLNVATAAGIVIYELLRKYRSLVERLRCGPCA